MSGFVSSMCQFILSVDGSMSCSSFLTAKTSPWSSYTWKLYRGLPSTQTQPTKSISHTDLRVPQIKQCDRVRAPYDQHTNGSTHTGYFDFTLVKWSQSEEVLFCWLLLICFEDYYRFGNLDLELHHRVWPHKWPTTTDTHTALHPHLGEGILYTTCHVNVPFGLWT